MAKSIKSLTKADIARLGPDARQQVLNQIGGTVVSLPIPRQPRAAARKAAETAPRRAGLGPTKGRSTPWGPFYPIMLSILLIIIWELLEAALS